MVGQFIVELHHKLQVDYVLRIEDDIIVENVNLCASLSRQRIVFWAWALLRPHLVKYNILLYMLRFLSIIKKYYFQNWFSTPVDTALE